MGRMTEMFPGVRPIILRADTPTASISPVVLFCATTDGSLNTTPFPCTNTSVFAVPKSIPRSCDKLNLPKKISLSKAIQSLYVVLLYRYILCGAIPNYLNLHNFKYCIRISRYLKMNDNKRQFPL